MEPQYLSISKQDAEKLEKLGIKTQAMVSIKEGEKKIIGYTINLSNLLAYLEKQHELIEKIKEKHQKLEDIEKNIKDLEDKIKKKQEELEKNSV